MTKINPICKICTGWLAIVVINNQDWFKCGSCGWMDKVPKISITPVGVREM